jgi:protein gp37
MADTTIEWTDKTWNPVRGCERVSEGCRNCYAEVMAARFSDPGLWGHGIAQWVIRPGGIREARWTGKIVPVPDKLPEPMTWRAPARVFVNSTSDLFHKDVPRRFIDKVFAVMALTPQHTYQILTKRPEVMKDYMNLWQDGSARVHHVFSAVHDLLVKRAGKRGWSSQDPEFARAKEAVRVWPLPNVWLGVSAEDQKTFDDRVEHLGQVPAAVRFVSAEPLLGYIDVGNAFDDADEISPYQPINWVIAGLESGPNARQGNIDHVRHLVRQCRRAGKAVFVKQLGADPIWNGMSIPGESDPWPAGTLKEDRGEGYFHIRLKSRKGGDMAEWPEDLQVREFPA